MTNQDKAEDCIRYCLIKKNNKDKNKRQAAIKKIAKALYSCDMSQQSIKECIILLKVFQDEG